MAKAKVTILKCADIAHGVAHKHEISVKTATEIIEDVIESIKDGAEKGKTKIKGLGVFTVKKVKARIARNPKTGEEAQVKAHKKLTFRPSKENKHID